ncbi:hypothetical protein N6L24_14025 [Cognatishimia sp. SS12]|uniref:hypothetical protein n=1 Tax=Cognatishimia sp. SS12 TaxID=2979465 RepID=UPI00232C7D24|nr:hypothetical protein [Cognatishimia sp. SS12]MDC0739402.1 hypothetical protein [Cognatishimia sp. SS12]
MKTVADGLLFHPDGSTGADVLKRMVEGTTNYNLDDPFKPAIDETEQEVAKLDEQIFCAEQRLIALRHEKVRAQQRLEQQQTAKERFAETGEIDEALLPCTEVLAKAEAAQQREEIKEAEAAKFLLPVELRDAGWIDDPVRVTETEVIITIRKRRTDEPVDVEQTEKRIAKVVENAMQPFRVNDSHYRCVLRERIARRPQQPKGPPDD